MIFIKILTGIILISLCTTAFVHNMSLTCAVDSLPEIDLSFVLHNVKQKEIENEG